MKEIKGKLSDLEIDIPISIYGEPATLSASKDNLWELHEIYPQDIDITIRFKDINSNER